MEGDPRLVCYIESSAWTLIGIIDREMMAREESVRLEWKKILSNGSLTAFKRHVTNSSTHGMESSGLDDLYVEILFSDDEVGTAAVTVPDIHCDNIASLNRDKPVSGNFRTGLCIPYADTTGGKVSLHSSVHKSLPALEPKMLWSSLR